MSLMALIAEQQIKNKVGQGYTDLPPDVNGLMDTWNLASTTISNVPNVANDAIQGVMAFLTDPELRKQSYKQAADFTLGTAESLKGGPLFDTEQGKEKAPDRIKSSDEMLEGAIDGVKAVLDPAQNFRNAREMLSQNPDLFAGGLWGASKAGKFAGKHLGPKLAEKTEKMLTDQGLIKHIMPPDSKTFGKGGAYTTGEFLKLGQFPQGELSRMAHKFRGREGYMSGPGYGKGISETDFIKLMKSDGETFQKFGVNNLEEAIDMLQGKVGLDRLEEMMAGSMVTLEKPLYIERAEGYGGAKDTPVDVKDTSLYSATMVDPANEAVMKMGSAYGKNPYIIKLEAGTQIYHPSGNADLSELVVKGKDINKSQGMKKGDYKVESKRKLGDTLFDWDQIDKERKTAWHNSDAKFDAVDPKKWETGPLGDGHYMITNPNAKNFYEGKYQYESLLPGNIDEVTVVVGRNSKQSSLVQKAFISIQKDLPNVDLDLKKGGMKTRKFDSSSTGAEYAYSMVLDELGLEKGYALLKKHGIRGMRNDGKTPSYAIFDMDKIEMKRIEQSNKKKSKSGQGLLDFD